MSTDSMKCSSSDPYSSSDSARSIKPPPTPVIHSCTLCKENCSLNTKIIWCEICGSPYCSIPCFESDEAVHRLLCAGVNDHLPPGHRLGLRFLHCQKRADWVWLQEGTDPSYITTILERTSSTTVELTHGLLKVKFPWWLITQNDGNVGVWPRRINPVRDRPMRNFCVYKMPNTNQMETNSIKETISLCQKWLDFDRNFGVPSVETLPPTMRSWKGDFIFDAGPNSGGINMRDVRDIVDFLSVCQEDNYTEMSRGEREARSQKRIVVSLDFQGGKESDPKVQTETAELHLPLDHPMLRKWRRPAAERRGRWEQFSFSQHGHAMDPEIKESLLVTSPMVPMVAPMVKVLKALRLPLIAEETHPTTSPHRFGDASRPKRIILRKGNYDFDAKHAEAWVKFFQKHGVRMTDAFPPGSEDAPSNTISPFWLRRFWKYWRTDLLRCRCIVEDCKGRADCPFVPEGHDCWTVVCKRVAKEVSEVTFKKREYERS